MLSSDNSITQNHHTNPNPSITCQPLNQHRYNCENGGPAPEKLTNAIYGVTKTINKVRICESFPEVDVSKVGSTTVTSDDGASSVIVDVVSATDDHVNLLKTIFDFDKIRNLMQRPDFSFAYDCMHGVQGPYAHQVFVTELGAPPDCLLNAVPSETFNGHHADPNLTYARDICEVMRVDREGNAMEDLPGKTTPAFGAAADGDADRNMILG